MNDDSKKKKMVLFYSTFTGVAVKICTKLSLSLERSKLNRIKHGVNKPLHV